MSVEHKRELLIVDESGDGATFSTDVQVENDSVDFTDDEEVLLVSVKIAGTQPVNISRADLQELRIFLEEVAEADVEAQG